MADRRSRDSVLMDCAYAFSSRSTCKRGEYGSVGAVIALDGRILSTGYNGAPAGMPHCNHTCDCGSFNKYGDVCEPHGTNCAAVRPCLATVHAETNAITYAARHGVRIEGASLYTTVSPCLPCALIIVNAGLTTVVYGTQYRDPTGVNYLASAGVAVLRIGGWEE